MSRRDDDEFGIGDIDDGPLVEDNDPLSLEALSRRIESLESKVESWEDDLRRARWGIPLTVLVLALAYWLFGR